MALVDRQVSELLRKRDFEALNYLFQDDRRVWRVLQSYLFQTDEMLRWRSIEGTAAILQKKWEAGKLEKAREYLRRLVWSISDESGGIGWSAPQVIAEAVAAIPDLGDPFINLMIDRALSEPPLVKSGLWGIGRLGWRAGEAVTLFREAVLKPFEADDPETLGLAAWALGETGLESARPHLEKLLVRPEVVRIYIAPDFREQALGRWAEEAIGKIDRNIHING